MLWYKLIKSNLILPSVFAFILLFSWLNIFSRCRSKMASGGRLKTFGEKPKSFALEENGELYYIGSEVRKIV